MNRPAGLIAFQFLKRTISCRLPQYQFNSSCFSTSTFPLHLYLSCQTIWQRGLGSIFHLSSMVNQWHQSYCTCGSSWPNCTCQGGNGQRNGALVHCCYVCVCVWCVSSFMKQPDTKHLLFVNYLIKFSIVNGCCAADKSCEHSRRFVLFPVWTQWKVFLCRGATHPSTSWRLSFRKTGFVFETREIFQEM